MKKAKVNKIYLSDKIYIKKKDVEDDDLLLSLYTYDNGDEFLSTISEDEDYYIVPSNSYHKLEWDEIEDQRNFEQTEADLNFIGTLRWEQKEVVDKFLPGEYAISFIDRPTYYSECGFVGYNLRQHETRLFVSRFEDIYTNLNLVKEDEWHDSYLFDVVRKKYLKNVPQFNLSPTIRRVGNPWPDTPMAEYMDHLKGKARKDAGEMLP